MPIVKVEKSEWLKVGINKFSDQGLEGINVEQMASQLKCNKSGFYWYFKSRENFLKEMIFYWFENSVKSITSQIEEEETAQRRFLLFLQLSFQDKSRKDFMFFLRKIAQSDAHLHKLLEDLREKRVSVSAQLIKDLGYSDVESRLKADILMNFYIGWYEIHKYKTDNEQEDLDYAFKLIRNFINF